MLATIFDKYDLFLLVLMRMTGFVMFNPIFGRRNIPNNVKAPMAFVFALAAIIPMERDPELDKYVSNIIAFMLIIAKEVVFGYLLGLIVNIYFAVVAISGEIMDMQMGLNMSKMYDPGSNIQMPLAGSFFNIALMLMFFMTNSHNTFMELITVSFEISPVTSFHFNADIGIHLINLFAHIFILSLKFGFPIMAAELVTETGVGIIMRAVPQINVFVVGVQLKIIVALLIMIVISPVSTWFFDAMLREMNNFIYSAFVRMAS